MELVDLAVTLMLLAALGIAHGLARDGRLDPAQRRLPGPRILWAVAGVALVLIGFLLFWTRIES